VKGIVVGIRRGRAQTLPCSTGVRSRGAFGHEPRDFGVWAGHQYTAAFLLGQSVAVLDSRDRGLYRLRDAEKKAGLHGCPAGGGKEV